MKSPFIPSDFNFLILNFNSKLKSRKILKHALYSSQGVPGPLYSYTFRKRRADIALEGIYPEVFREEMAGIASINAFDG
jgi:hypothetical protein